MHPDDSKRAIEAVWRIESARLIAGLTRMVRDVALAEDLAQDALVAALEEWPKTGLPEKPGAWLMAAAQRRAIDFLRRRKVQKRKHEEIGRAIEALEKEPAADAGKDDVVGDDLLRLVFMACHPALAPEARVALTLRLVGGLTTDEIARAFLVPEPTIAQRLVRAKRRIQDEGLPLDVPSPAQLPERLDELLRRRSEKTVLAMLDDARVDSNR